MVCLFAYVMARLLVLFAGMESPDQSQLWRKSLRTLLGVFVCSFVGLLACFVCMLVEPSPRPVAIMKKKFEKSSWCVRLLICWRACLFCLLEWSPQARRNYEEKVWEKLVVCSFAYLLACVFCLHARGTESQTSRNYEEKVWERLALSLPPVPLVETLRKP